MQFSKILEPVTLIRRYKRFLADVLHPSLGEITVYCPNTGSMKNCWQEGWRVWLLDSENLKRKYRYTWVLSENDEDEFIGIHSQLANDIVYEAIVNQQIIGLERFSEIKREVAYGAENSRVDIWLKDEVQRETFLEIKSVTLKEDDGIGYFPDAVSKRGQKHLRELIECVKKGHRAILLFLVQHAGISQVSIAGHIDRRYYELTLLAVELGVDILVYNVKMTKEGIAVDQQLEFVVN